MLRIAALVLSVALPAGAPARPPDGTYTYSIGGRTGTGITATIVIQSAGATLTVSEAATLPGNKSVLVRTAYDAGSMLPTHYELHQRSPLGNSDLMASIDRTSVTFNGLPLSYKSTAASKFITIGEGLAAYRVMLPWTLMANDRAPFTFAALNGNLTLSATVVPVSQARPASVHAGDDALAAKIGDDTLTFWFNPQTHVTDEVDASSGVAVQLQSYKPEITALAEPPAVSHSPLARPTYVDKDVSFASSGGAVLSGTLSIPAGHAKRYPAIVFVHGSGAGTRDGGTAANPTFLLLGNALANRGVAVLRYDKRGIGKSTGTATEDWHPLGDDARAAVAFLKQRSDIDSNRIFALGHSEGGLVVPLVANALKARAIVLMAPPAIPLHDILVKQGFASMSPAMQKMFTDQLAAYDGVDPARVIQTVNVPVMLLQGGKDGQVLASDFPKLVNAARAAHRHARTVLLPQDDHLFIVLPRSQATQGDEVTQPHPLDPRVARAILQFMAPKGTP